MIPDPDPGATPLDPDESVGLIPSHIATREELNTWEWANVIDGERWALKNIHRELLSSRYVRTLHRRMFGHTWRWAGQFRLTEKNIGIEPSRIPMAVEQLCADVQAQLEAAAFAIDEIAVRFSHRLVAIHPFANGNGRHSRTMADLLLMQRGAPRFSWGANQNQDAETTRQGYLRALRAADRGDYAPLLRFARS
jgi:Fic-DOC domain mobile mystery protein B